jgi:hypothetical protein
MGDLDEGREWRQTQHRILRAEILCVAALVVLTVLTVAAALSKFVQ